MGLNQLDRALVEAMQDGLPLVPRPFAIIGGRLGLSEEEVLAHVRRLCAAGVIKRFGLVVHHRPLGYVANAMVVWDVPDDRVDEIGRRVADTGLVSLCYRRPRRLPHWPYNLFCMIHARSRNEVLQRLQRMIRELRLETIPHEVLFSRRCFKQCGAHYIRTRATSPTQHPPSGQALGAPA
jgi:Transcriptional regulators